MSHSYSRIPLKLLQTGRPAAGDSSPVSASLCLNHVIWPELCLLHTAKLMLIPLNDEPKRGFKYHCAVVNNMQ